MESTGKTLAGSLPYNFDSLLDVEDNIQADTPLISVYLNNLKHVLLYDELHKKNNISYFYLKHYWIYIYLIKGYGYSS